MLDMIADSKKIGFAAFESNDMAKRPNPIVSRYYA